MSAQSMKCPVCESSATLTQPAFPGYSEATRHQIYSCQSCDVAFALPRVLDAQLYDRIYDLADQLPGYDRYATYARQVTRSTDPLGMLASAEDVYWGVTQSLAELNPQTARVLDVGSGLGYLTYALSRRGYLARGLDISSSAVDAAKVRFGDLFDVGSLDDHSASHPGEYDAVVACELIEHLEDPAAFIATALRLLKPGGRLIVTTPNRTLYGTDAIW
jgi:SAM-dependent methyltransferase